MKFEELLSNAETTAKEGYNVAIFGKSCIWAENHQNASHIIFFDYGTPIFDVYITGIEGDRRVNWYKLEGWRYSPSTTRHTKTALDIVCLAIQIRCGIYHEPEDVFVQIDDEKIVF